MRLHEQVKRDAKIIARYEEAMQDLRRYVSLPKYYDRHGVNPADILLRINEINQDIFTLDCE